MRTTRLSTLLALATLLAAPTFAHANCYSVYDAQNRLSFQSTVTPIDLSARISDGMRSRFPGGFFVMIPDDSDCREVHTAPTVSPRLRVRRRSESSSPPAPRAAVSGPPLLRRARRRHERQRGDRQRHRDARGGAQRQRGERQAPLKRGHAPYGRR